MSSGEGLWQPEMTQFDSWVRADKEGEGGVRSGVPHEVGFVVNLQIQMLMMIIMTKYMIMANFTIIIIITINQK